MSFKPYKPLYQRIWENVSTWDGLKCWNWKLRLDDKGYGVIKVNSRPVKAHRAAYSLTNGPIPAGLHVCHKCDNPACCNPAHLFLGTARDNKLDSFAKGRSFNPPIRKGSAVTSAKLTDSEVKIIRELRKSGERVVVIAKKYSVNQSTIYAVCNKQAWSHI